MHINSRSIFFSFFSALTLLSAPVVFAADTETKAGVTSAKATLAPTQGNSVSGEATFTQTPDGIKIVADITGLTPGEHGFHVHEFGDCSAPDAMSAGGHFNPTNQPHGAPNAAQHHVGDFGNVMADKDGKAHYEFVDKSISFEGQNNILGHSVIIHEKRDDLHSQPVGNAGARLACGVIK